MYSSGVWRWLKYGIVFASHRRGPNILAKLTSTFVSSLSTRDVMSSSSSSSKDYSGECLGPAHYFRALDIFKVQEMTTQCTYCVSQHGSDHKKSQFKPFKNTSNLHKHVRGEHPEVATHTDVLAGENKGNKKRKVTPTSTITGCFKDTQQVVFDEALVDMACSPDVPKNMFQTPR